MLISKISQQSSKIFGETHVKEVYDKKVENLLKQHGDGLGSSEKINKEFAERMLYEMSCRVLSEFSTSISNYKDGVGDLISIYTESLGSYSERLNLPVSVINTVYKQDINRTTSTKE